MEMSCSIVLLCLFTHPRSPSLSHRGSPQICHPEVGLNTFILLFLYKSTLKLGGNIPKMTLF